MQDYDATLGIYSDHNYLINKLETKFKDKYLDVQVFDNPSNVDLNNFSYLIINLLNTKKNIEDLKKMISGLECKIIVLSPLYVNENEKYLTELNLQSLIDLNSNLGIILVPEILGNDVGYLSSYISHEIIMKSILSERIKTTHSTSLINTISVGKLVEVVIKETFSFGIAGKRLSLIGPKIAIKTFATKYLGISSENLIQQSGGKDNIEIDSDVSMKVDFSMQLAVTRTRNTFSKFTSKEILKPVPKHKIFNLKHIAQLIMILIIFLSTPIIIMLVSLLFFVASCKYVLIKPSLAKNLMAKSRDISYLANNLSYGSNFIFSMSNLIYKSSGIVNEGFLLVSQNPYNLSGFADDLSAGLDKIHTDIGFLQSDINELDGFSGVLVKNYLDSRNINIGEYKSKIYHFKQLSSRISDILGFNKTKKYLILFQNNMELRPTGGFIGSYSLITFDKGNLTEMVVEDVYSADGQLKGHVDPPEPIRRYLGEGGWYMRDANWDPSFPDSATKIEWFLDKEIGRQVDGVIAIDLSFVKRMLEVTGPITLNDFGKVIDSKNLYQTTQSEVENDFFPGSIKKASFLTSLSKELINQIKNLPQEKYLIFVKEIYDSLEKNSIQIFLHDENSEQALDDLGYSGKLNMNTNCGIRCFRDSYSVIDANLGVNKSNFFINKSQELTLSISKEFIGHELHLIYNNSSSQSAGSSGVYKNYSRLVIPKDSNVSGVRAYNIDGSYEDLQFDTVDINERKEIGYYFELLPESSKKIQIVWNIDDKSFDSGGEYNLDIIKQAGIDQDNLKIVVNTNNLALTGKASSVYNTILDKDFRIKLFFKPL